MSDRKTDGGKSDRIPGASTPASLSAYEAGYAGIQWGDGVDGTQDEPTDESEPVADSARFGRRITRERRTGPRPKLSR